MPPTPPSTTSSSAGGQSPDSQFKVVRKRNRVPLSCAPCRHRKLKCNRTKPCENCVKRGDAASCSYAAPGTRRKNQSQAASSPDDMQNRIDRLEGLVLSLMTNGRNAPGPSAAQDALSRAASNETTSPSQDDDHEEGREGEMIIVHEGEGDSDVDSVTDSLGILKVDNEKHKSFYIGDSHWHSVLKDIAEVKNYFIVHKKELDSHYRKVKESLPPNASGGPAFLFSAHDTPSEDEIRAALPPRAAVEKLVTRYFNSYDPAVHILHSPTFHNELFEHWKHPEKTSLVWLGTLFAILCLAMQSYHKIGDEPPEWKGKALDLAASYRLCTVHCLVTSDYTKSVDYTVETIILYIHGEYSSRWDAEVGLWLIAGILVRIAMRMGYHRDPKHYAGITPFRGEMRRRVWSFIRQCDVMFSFHLGLPSMIRSCDSDTDFPRNIFEDEFGPNSKELPPPRPASEPTPVSYSITKAKVSFEFGEILEKINAVTGPSIGYDEILARDGRLRELRASFPPHLRLRPVEECIHDPATLLMQRYALDILYSKTVCVLHRKYALRARQNPRYAHSRRSCLDASLAILQHQATLYRESQPGGRMRTMKWVISSLTKHDFLMAAVLLCLDLHYDSLAIKQGRPSGALSRPEQRAEMTAMLETSYQIWNESAETSVEAYKASHILKIMLDQIRTDSSGALAREPTSTADAFAPFDAAQPEHSAAMTLGMLSSGGLTPNTAALFNAATPGLSGSGVDLGISDMTGGTGLTPGFSGESAFPLNLFGPTSSTAGMDDLPMNLDWEAWDSFVQNPNMSDPNSGFQLFPTNLDPSQLNNDIDQSAFTNNAFMGANTPGK